jgi:cyclin G-associated kinase
MLDGVSRKYIVQPLLFQYFKKQERVSYDVICLQKKLSGHPNIITFITAAAIDKAHSDHGQHEFLLLTELCAGV